MHLHQKVVEHILFKRLNEAIATTARGPQAEGHTSSRATGETKVAAGAAVETAVELIFDSMFNPQNSFM